MEVQRARVHRPTLGRQIIFELIIVAELICMLSFVILIDNKNSLINDEILRLKNYIICWMSGLYIASLLLKLCYYQLHPWPLPLPKKTFLLNAFKPNTIEEPLLSTGKGSQEVEGMDFYNR